MPQTYLAFAFVILVGSGCASQSSQDDPRRAAEEQAQRDIRAGVLELHTYGLVDDDASAELLHQRFGVRLVRVASCVVSPRDIAAAETYNRLMRAEIERRFGVGCLRRLRHNADAPVAATQPAA